METILLNIIVPFIEALTCILILSLVIKKNFIIDNKKKSFVFILLFVIIGFTIRRVVPYGIHPIVIIIIDCMVFFIITRVSIKKILLGFVVFIIYTMTIEMSVIICATFLLEMNSNEILKIPELSNLLLTISKSIEVIIIFIVTRYKKKSIIAIKKGDKNPIVNYWIFGVFIMSIMILNFLAMGKYDVELRYFIAAVYIVFIFFILLGYFEYKNFIEYIKMKYKFEKNEKELENLESMIDVIRKQKHDFANIVNTVYAISVMNKPDCNEKIRSYLKNIINDSTTPNYFYDTGNDYLDGLLAMKKKDADNEGVNFEVDFDCAFDDIKIKDNDLVKIISNIIDNALEALKKYENENKVISIYHWIEDNKSNLSISNNGPKIKESLSKKIFHKGFTEKIEESKEHGYGLYIVKELVEENNGKIVVESDENSTEFLIKLPMGSAMK